MSKIRAQTVTRVNRLLTPSAYKSLLEKSTARVVPLDATWYLPNAGRDGAQEFLSERIPGARFFDIDKVKDENSQYPHMLPSTEVFNSAMSKLGLRRDDTLVVYDKQGNFSAPRLLWTLQVFQHPEVFLLDNYPEYKSVGLPIDSKVLKKVEDAVSEFGSYESPGLLEDKVVSYADLRVVMIEPLFRQKFNIIDARPHARWTGEAPEPRPGLPSGHLIDSISIPFTEVLVPGTKVFKSPEELTTLFLSKGLDPNKSTIAMCGTGVTACVLETALQKAGMMNGDKSAMVYDGSWTEWASRDISGAFIETGEK
ncbi:Rhodanese-like domain-containing protein [Lipomyces oligophaga]|uniref:Rhodanese-like domain-containing protein n=1 Tax=Lipomyces oligophaga TaxID=45792 RepID=UPI0034CD76D5